jgi:hypothetical protein
VTVENDESQLTVLNAEDLIPERIPVLRLRQMDASEDTYYGYVYGDRTPGIPAAEATEAWNRIVSLGADAPAGQLRRHYEEIVLALVDGLTPRQASMLKYEVLLEILYKLQFLNRPTEGGAAENPPANGTVMEKPRKNRKR